MAGSRDDNIHNQPGIKLPPSSQRIVEARQVTNQNNQRGQTNNSSRKNVRETSESTRSPWAWTRTPQPDPETESESQFQPGGLFFGLRHGHRSRGQGQQVQRRQSTSAAATGSSPGPSSDGNGGGALNSYSPYPNLGSPLSRLHRVRRYSLDSWQNPGGAGGGDSAHSSTRSTSQPRLQEQLLLNRPRDYQVVTATAGEKWAQVYHHLGSWIAGAFVGWFASGRRGRGGRRRRPCRCGCCCWRLICLLLLALSGLVVAFLALGLISVGDVLWFLVRMAARLLSALFTVLASMAAPTTAVQAPPGGAITSSSSSSSLPTSSSSASSSSQPPAFVTCKNWPTAHRPLRLAPMFGNGPPNDGHDAADAHLLNSQWVLDQSQLQTQIQTHGQSQKREDSGAIKPKYDLPPLLITIQWAGTDYATSRRGSTHDKDVVTRNNDRVRRLVRSLKANTDKLHNSVSHALDELVRELDGTQDRLVSYGNKQHQALTELEAGPPLFGDSDDRCPVTSSLGTILSTLHSTVDNTADSLYSSATASKGPVHQAMASIQDLRTTVTGTGTEDASSSSSSSSSSRRRILLEGAAEAGRIVQEHRRILRKAVASLRAAGEDMGQIELELGQACDEEGAARDKVVVLEHKRQAWPWQDAYWDGENEQHMVHELRTAVAHLRERLLGQDGHLRSAYDLSRMIRDIPDAVVSESKVVEEKHTVLKR